MMTGRTAAALMIAAVPLQAQGDAPRTEPARASVYVTLAADQRTAIAKDRLTLMLDGAPQDIVACAGGPHPLNVIALLDFSSTMHFHGAPPGFVMIDYGSEGCSTNCSEDCPGSCSPQIGSVSPASRAAS